MSKCSKEEELVQADLNGGLGRFGSKGHLRSFVLFDHLLVLHGWLLRVFMQVKVNTFFHIAYF